MKKLLLSSLFITLLVAGTADAQLREDLTTPNDYSGPIVNTNAPTVNNGLDRFFRTFKMSHSYSMNFGSYGGNYQNVNAYTNTMQFSLSPRLNGRVDVSFLHSPFGGNAYSSPGGFENQVVIENAELNYQISDKANISIQYRQIPNYFGYSPFGSGYGYGYSRYDRFRNYGWY